MRNVLFYILIFALSLSCKNTGEDTNSASTNSENHLNLENNRILFIVSNQHTYGNTDINTSNHFAEIVLAYDVLKKQGYSIDFVSPKGGAIPIGYISTSDTIQKKYLYDFEFMKLLKHTRKPEEIRSSNYTAVYFGGGGAAMFGVPENEAIQKIAMEVYEKNEDVVSAICHGTAGLVNLKTTNGKFLYEGKKVNGFPDLFENMEAEYYKQFPFSIEQVIQARGGDFSYSKEGWDNYSIADGRLITGQDPTAAASVAEKIIKALKNNTK